ncbi:response regulator [Vibrio tapetis subsp. quintayensis]|uniref:response regulator n=1 Tax=Vibrio tapetis TaxID=52443 RepID=UPI0025B5CC60|nr:HD domain-containing phosphohydrolase [Vibrio tapetis]MDN3680633.1 response regulator [Vibrio tapetis subsp. quintayensis]
MSGQTRLDAGIETETLGEAMDVSLNNFIDKPKLLILDDEPDIVKALTRVLRKDFEISAFVFPLEALAYLADNDVDIILSDMRMPKMDGAEFFAQSRKTQPHAIRVLLTGYADVEATTRAINDGGVNSYLTKPWDNNNLRFSLLQSASLFTLQSEKKRLKAEIEQKNKELELANATLEDKVASRTEALRASFAKLKSTHQSRSALFRDILSLITTLIEYRTDIDAHDLERIAYQCKQVAILMGLDDGDIKQTYMSAIMHKLGLIGEDPSATSSQNFAQSHIAPTNNPLTAHEIISNMTRFSALANLVKYQDENLDGTGYPDHIKGDDIPTPSRIIRVVKDYDFMVTNSNKSLTKSPAAAMNYLETHCGTIYDRSVLTQFKKVLRDRPQDDVHNIVYCVSVNDLAVGVIIKRDVVLPNGTTMLTQGSEINQSTLERLREYESNHRTALAYFI